MDPEPDLPASEMWESGSTIPEGQESPEECRKWLKDWRRSHVPPLCQWGLCWLPAITELRATPQSEPLRVCRGHELVLMRAQAGWQEEG